MSMIRKASRKHRYLKIGIGGISGSGKTLGALKMAYGITGDWEKIVIIDSENNSADLYAHLGPYDVLPLEDKSPAGYINAFQEIERAGNYDVMIVDSLSHEYIAPGGILDMADKIASTSKSGNTFQAWGKVTPLHTEWVDYLLNIKMHVIGTLRKKSDYVIEQNDRGKAAPRKVGLKTVQKEGLSYEFDVLLDISANHLCSVEKDRTSLFDGKMAFDLTEKVGEALRNWANEGDPITEEKPVKKTAPKKEFKPNPQPVEHDPEIFEDKPENKRLIMEHFARVGLDTTNKEAMISVYQMMINKPLDVAEKTLADFCRELEASK